MKDETGTGDGDISASHWCLYAVIFVVSLLLFLIRNFDYVWFRFVLQVVEDETPATVFSMFQDSMFVLPWHCLCLALPLAFGVTQSLRSLSPRSSEVKLGDSLNWFLTITFLACCLQPRFCGYMPPASTQSVSLGFSAYTAAWLLQALVFLRLFFRGATTRDRMIAGWVFIWCATVGGLRLGQVELYYSPSAALVEWMNWTVVAALSVYALIEFLRVKSERQQFRHYSGLCCSLVVITLHAAVETFTSSRYLW